MMAECSSPCDTSAGLAFLWALRILPLRDVRDIFMRTRPRQAEPEATHETEPTLSAVCSSPFTSTPLRQRGALFKKASEVPLSQVHARVVQAQRREQAQAGSQESEEKAR